MERKIVTLVASVAVVTLMACQKQPDPPAERTLEVEGSTSLRRTGTSKVAEVTVEDPLVLDGQFSCHEAEIVGGVEAGKRTVELGGASIRSRTGGRFSVLIEYVVRSGEVEVKGSTELTSVAGRPTGTISLTKDSEDFYPDESFEHVPPGLTECTLKLSPIPTLRLTWSR